MPGGYWPLPGGLFPAIFRGVILDRHVLGTGVLLTAHKTARLNQVVG
jgi:hypothetical protein